MEDGRKGRREGWKIEISGSIAAISPALERHVRDLMNKDQSIFEGVFIGEECGSVSCWRREGPGLTEAPTAGNAPLYHVHRLMLASFTSTIIYPKRANTQ